MTRSRGGGTRVRRSALLVLAALLVLTLAGIGLTVLSAGERATSPPVPAPQQAEPPDANIDVVLLADGLDRPLGLAFTGGPRDPVFIAQQGGVIRLLVDGELRPDPVLDLSDHVLVGGEQGMLGIAIHPRFADNGRLFVTYSHVDGYTVLAEYVVSDGVADAESARELLHLPQESRFHKGGALAFDADGLLYVTIGDDAWPRLTTPDFTDSLRGTIVRLDVDRADPGGGPYAVPDGNAFADGNGPPEVFDYGLRNPWRMTIDAASGDLYVADVGSERYEEVDRHRGGTPAGLDYGWAALEGFECRRQQVREELDCSAERDAAAPLLVLEGSHFHSGDCAVIGGYVYRGSAIPDLRGTYLFGDFCSGKIRAIATEGDRPNVAVLLDTTIAMSSFGVDADGELYVADVAKGEIWKIVPGS